MDSLRAFDEAYDVDLHEDEAVMEAPPEIGIDERRMHVRAYNYWVSLLDGRAYPSIEDLDPATLDDFGPHSVLLDFTQSVENPVIAFLGRALRDECGFDAQTHHIAEVPARSLLSRLTDHYLQIIANCAPIGFEAEFVNQRGHNTLYRGILMPLSSDGDTIDFIYGVINWKEVADSDTVVSIAREVRGAVAASSARAENPVWADGPNADPEVLRALAGEHGQAEFELVLPPDASLADRLHLARECAENARHADVRSRAALYRALGQAYDFALAAEAEPEDYAEVLDDAGLKAQARAPMTPIAKLVFGIDYDKTRLTEFAAALSYGRREEITEGGFAEFLESFSGGLKGVVAAERKLRRPAPKADTGETARTALRSAPSRATVEIETSGAEFVLLVARREADGRLAIVAPVEGDAALLERALRKAAA